MARFDAANERDVVNGPPSPGVCPPTGSKSQLKSVVSTKEGDPLKKLTSRVKKVGAQVVGLDVHKQMIAYCILDRSGCEVASGEIGARPAALEKLMKRFVGRKQSHFSFECSGYSLWVYDLLVDRYGAERVHVAQSKKIRAIANSQEKNDANDAFWLAYLTHEGRLPESYVPRGALSTHPFGARS